MSTNITSSNLKFTTGRVNKYDRSGYIKRNDKERFTLLLLESQKEDPADNIKLGNDLLKLIKAGIENQRQSIVENSSTINSRFFTTENNAPIDLIGMQTTKDILAQFAILLEKIAHNTKERKEIIAELRSLIREFLNENIKISKVNTSSPLKNQQHTINQIKNLPSDSVAQVLQSIYHDSCDIGKVSVISSTIGTIYGNLKILKTTINNPGLQNILKRFQNKNTIYERQVLIQTDLSTKFARTNKPLTPENVYEEFGISEDANNQIYYVTCHESSSISFRDLQVLACTLKVDGRFVSAIKNDNSDTITLIDPELGNATITYDQFNQLLSPSGSSDTSKSITITYHNAQNPDEQISNLYSNVAIYGFVVENPQTVNIDLEEESIADESQSSVSDDESENREDSTWSDLHALFDDIPDENDTDSHMEPIMPEIPSVLNATTVDEPESLNQIRDIIQQYISQASLSVSNDALDKIVQSIHKEQQNYNYSKVFEYVKYFLTHKEYLMGWINTEEYPYVRHLLLSTDNDIDFVEHEVQESIHNSDRRAEEHEAHDSIPRNIQTVEQIFTANQPHNIQYNQRQLEESNVPNTLDADQSQGQPVNYVFGQGMAQNIRDNINQLFVQEQQLPLNFEHQITSYNIDQSFVSHNTNNINSQIKFDLKVLQDTFSILDGDIKLVIDPELVGFNDILNFLDNINQTNDLQILDMPQFIQALENLSTSIEQRDQMRLLNNNELTSTDLQTTLFLTDDSELVDDINILQNQRFILSEPYNLFSTTSPEILLPNMPRVPLISNIRQAILYSMRNMMQCRVNPHNEKPKSNELHNKDVRSQGNQFFNDNLRNMFPNLIGRSQDRSNIPNNLNFTKNSFISADTNLGIYVPPVVRQNDINRIINFRGNLVTRSPGSGMTHFNRLYANHMSRRINLANKMPRLRGLNGLAGISIPILSTGATLFALEMLNNKFRKPHR